MIKNIFRNMEFEDVWKVLINFGHSWSCYVKEQYLNFIIKEYFLYFDLFQLDITGDKPDIEQIQFDIFDQVDDYRDGDFYKIYDITIELFPWNGSFLLKVYAKCDDMDENINNMLSQAMDQVYSFDGNGLRVLEEPSLSEYDPVKQMKWRESLSDNEVENILVSSHDIFECQAAWKCEGSYKSLDKVFNPKIVFKVIDFGELYLPKFSEKLKNLPDTMVPDEQHRRKKLTNYLKYHNMFHKNFIKDKKKDKADMTKLEQTENILKEMIK